MGSQDLAHRDVAAKVTAILHFYVDTKDTDIRSLSGVLDGGFVPQDISEFLRPIMWKLLTADPAATVYLSEAHSGLLDAYYDDVVWMTEKRKKTMEILQRTITAPPWLDFEESFAEKSGLKLIPVDARSLELRAREIDASVFPVEEIISTFESEREKLTDFWERWKADAANHDYGEQWDPDEGDQQEGRVRGAALGMAQGFVVHFAILYLYASRKPQSLLDFLKRRKMPFASKLANDVIRVYRTVKTPRQ